jgi:hypothetical protein
MQAADFLALTDRHGHTARTALSLRQTQRSQGCRGLIQWRPTRFAEEQMDFLA